MIRFSRSLTAAIAVAGVLLAMPAERAFSQVAELVVVDVKVVARGYRASKLKGTTVTNDKNEKIGEIDDIIIGRDKVLFAILQVGGFLGLGGHLVAVPYQSLVIDDTGRKIQLPGASRDALKKLQKFEYAA
jgi:sporulation protein YlmC with PRC-barrel domain